MSLEELRRDVEEITTLLSQATRQRIKNVLVIEKHRIETEIVNIEIKANAEAEAAKKGNINTSKVATTELPTKRYLVELNEYAWDQSEKFVKMFITLDGIQNLSEDDVKVTFTEKSMSFLAENLNNKDYGLSINNLLHSIDEAKSYRKIKTGMVAVYMKKKDEGVAWSHLTKIEKRLKDKHDATMKKEMKGEDALVNIMKRMFQSGDPQTKQMIAKAWTESQDRLMEK